MPFLMAFLWLVLFQNPGLAATPLESGVVHELNGPWDFHWQKTIDASSYQHQPDAQIPIDGKWTRFGFPEFGYGSYVLRIPGFAAAHQTYALKFPVITAATRVMAFPEKSPEKMVQAQAGIFSERQATYKPSAMPIEIQMYPDTALEPWIIIIHVANFTEASGGGMKLGPKLGDSRSLARYQGRAFLFENLVLGFVIAIMMYNVMLFIRERSDGASLALAVGCFGIIIRSIAKSAYVPTIFGSDSQEYYTGLKFFEHISVILSCLGFYYFALKAYADGSLGRTTRILTALALGPILVCFSLDVATMSRFVWLFQVIPLMACAVALYIFQKALRTRSEGIWYSMIGFLIVFTALVYDIFLAYGYVPEPPMIQYAIALFLFLQSQVIAKRFATAFKTASYLTRELKEEVARQTRQIRHLMDIIPQGIFTLHAGLRVGETFSQTAQKIFEGRDMAAVTLGDLLRSRFTLDGETVSLIESALNAALAEDPINWEMNRQLLPSRCDTRDGRHFEIEWHAIEEGGVVAEVLVIIRDITEIIKLRAVQDRNEKEFLLLKEFYMVSKTNLQKYCIQIDELLSQCQNTQSDSKKILTILHTIKGNSRQIGLATLASQVHDVESLIVKETTVTARVEHALHGLLLLWQNYKDVFSRLHGAEGESIHSISFNPDDWELLAREMKSRRPDPGVVVDIIKRAGFPALQDDLAQSERYARKAALGLQKLPPKLTISIPDVMLSDDQYEALQKAWIHLLNNSLDHGLETSDERLAKGKAAAGEIIVQGTVAFNSLILKYRDNGRGLHIKGIMEKAVAAQLLDPSQPSSPQDVAQLIFAPGFSTRDSVTEVSGRGLGMNAIRTFIEAAGGTTHIELAESGSDNHDFVNFAVVISLPLEAPFVSPRAV